MMALDAVIFDLDGTLVDANGLHTRAWHQAMEAHGYVVGQDRIAREIGKGGTMLVPSVLGEAAEAAEGEAMRDDHDRAFLDLVDREGVVPFEGVRDLFDALRARGLKTAIATAAQQESLDRVAKATGLDFDALADAVVTDTDVDRSKPHPDVVTAAVHKLGLSPAQCVMVGDTPYDVESAAGAGVACLGVLTGVHDAASLRHAGARATYRDVADLLAQLDDALHAGSPLAASLTQARIEALMQTALAEARKALAEDNVPVGCVLARGNGTILARGHSRTESRGHFLHHGEIVVFEEAGPIVPRHAGDLVLVSTLEPCVMCYGAAMEARVETIIYALAAPHNGGAARCAPMLGAGMLVPRVIGGVHAEESRALFEEWGARHPEAAFVQDLLDQA